MSARSAGNRRRTRALEDDCCDGVEMEAGLRTRRLRSGDEALAAELFLLVAQVFDEGAERVSEAYASDLLARREFWALAAFDGDVLVGGLTAHALPMTRDMQTELFIYDIAVQPAEQRRGIGRRLIEALLSSSREEGIRVAFVPADNEDQHALDFYRAVGGEAAEVTVFTFDDA